MFVASRLTAFVRQHSILLGIVALAILLEAFIVARSPVIAPDGIHFIQLAQDLEQSPVATMQRYDQHVGYPALILAVRRTLFCWTASEAAWAGAARVASALCGVLVVVVMWQLTRRIADERVALLAALLAALLPLLRQNAADALSDSFHLLVYLTAAWLVVLALARRSMWTFAAAGLCSGVAFAIRPEGFGVALVATLSAVVLPTWWRELGWRRTIAVAATIACAAALVTVPYIAVSGKLSGKLSSKVGWPKKLANETPTPPPSPRNAVATNASRKHVASTASAEQAIVPPPPPLQLTTIPTSAETARRPWPKAIGRGAAVLGERLGDGLHWVLLLPLGVGVVLSFRQRPSAQWQFLWLLSMFNVALLVLLYCLAGYIDRRHTMPLVALMLPTVAAGLLALASAARRFAFVERHRQVAAALSLVLLAAILLPRTLRPLHATHQHKPAAARLVDTLAAPGDTLLTNSAHVLYYAKHGGNIAGGAVIIHGFVDGGPSQPGGHRFAVIEQGGPLYHAAWQAELERDFTPVATIAADDARDQNKIVIYERRTMLSERQGASQR